MNPEIALSKNELVRFLGKPQRDFTREDIIRYVTESDIEMVNFMYPAADGRLKTLNFVINSLAYLETILTLGERVDGSSLFPFISAGSSDLYVVPRYRTAFRDPFAEIPTLTMLCSFCDKDGQPLEKVLKNFISVSFMRPPARPYRTDNGYAALMRQADFDKEAEQIENKETGKAGKKPAGRKKPVQKG